MHARKWANTTLAGTTGTQSNGRREINRRRRRHKSEQGSREQRMPMRKGERIRRSRARALTATGDVDGEKLLDGRPQSSALMTNTTIEGAQELRVSRDEVERQKAESVHAHRRANTTAGEGASPRQSMAGENQMHYSVRDRDRERSRQRTSRTRRQRTKCVQTRGTFVTRSLTARERKQRQTTENSESQCARANIYTGHTSIDRENEPNRQMED